MFRQKSLIVLCLLAWLGFPLLAQDAVVPTITFTLDFPGSEPEHFALSVHADGRATYDSNGKLSSLSEEGDPFHLEFIISPASRQRLFDLAKKSHYFDHDVDTKLPNIAFTGKKTVTYKDSKKDTEATYNYSANPAVQQLTAFCQQLSQTLEFGRRLQFYQRYQKLALDEELKRMEEMVQDNQLSELPAIAPILQNIANDHSVLNMVRGRALRILYKAGIHP